MQQTHPDFIMNNSFLKSKLVDQLEKFKDDKQYYYLKNIEKSFWTSLEPKFISPIVHIAS
jgi:hypothetical protein